MNRIVVKKTYFGVQYYNDCPYCGLNTNLLSEEERAVIGEIKYCKRCYNEKINKKQIKPRDYYELSVASGLDNLDNEIACFNLKKMIAQTSITEKGNPLIQAEGLIQKLISYWCICRLEPEWPWDGKLPILNLGLLFPVSELAWDSSVHYLCPFPV